MKLSPASVASALAAKSRPVSTHTMASTVSSTLKKAVIVGTLGRKPIDVFLPLACLHAPLPLNMITLRRYSTSTKNRQPTFASTAVDASLRPPPSPPLSLPSCIKRNHIQFPCVTNRTRCRKHCLSSSTLKSSISTAPRALLLQSMILHHLPARLVVNPRPPLPSKSATMPMGQHLSHLSQVHPV